MAKKAETKKSKKSLSKENTKKKLLQSGLEIFSKYGYDGATTKEISRHAGVNEALINRYFKGKAGLLEAVIVEYMHNSQLKVRDYPHGETFEEDLISFIKYAFSDFSSNPKFLKIILPLLMINPALEKRAQSALEIPNKKFFKRLQYFQKKKIIHPSRNLNEIVDATNFFICALIHNTVYFKISLIKKEKNIENMASMIAREFKNPK